MNKTVPDTTHDFFSFALKNKKYEVVFLQETHLSWDDAEKL